MNISVSNLLTLQSYSLNRSAHRQRMLRHRRERRIALGPRMKLLFEDELTIRHQIQEVLLADRATSHAAMQQEIDTYAHLVPDGTHWKATLLLEVPDATQRAQEMPVLSEAAHCLYIEAPGHPRILAHANEDLGDRHRGRPSGVHFLRFQFPQAMRAALVAGATTVLGCMHPGYRHWRVVPQAAIERLRRDLVVPTHKLEPPAFAAAQAA